MRNDSAQQLQKFDTNLITNSKMADKMVNVQSKVTAFVGLTKESLDGASDSLDDDREIKRRFIGSRKMMTRLSRTASVQLLLQGYGCSSSVYISFYISICYSILHFAVCQLGSNGWHSPIVEYNSEDSEDDGLSCN